MLYMENLCEWSYKFTQHQAQDQSNWNAKVTHTLFLVPVLETRSLGKYNYVPDPLVELILHLKSRLWCETNSSITDALVQMEL